MLFLLSFQKKKFQSCRVLLLRCSSVSFFPVFRLDPDERSNSAPKKFRCDPLTAYPDEAPLNRRNNNATAPFLSRRPSPPVTSHLDQLHVALRSQSTTNCDSRVSTGAVVVRANLADQQTSAESSGGRRRGGRVPPLHGTFEDVSDVVDGRVDATVTAAAARETVLSTSAPSTSGEGSTFLHQHFQQHQSRQQQHPNSKNSGQQRHHRHSQKGQHQYHSQLQQQRQFLQQEGHFQPPVSDSLSASRSPAAPSYLGASSVLYTQASHSASHRSSHPTTGGAFSYPTPYEINASRNQPNNNHEGQLEHSLRGVHRGPTTSDVSFNPHPAGAHSSSHFLVGAPSSSSSSSGAFAIPSAVGGLYLEPQTPPVSVAKSEEIHHFPAFGGYSINMAVKVELPPALSSSQHRPTQDPTSAMSAPLHQHHHHHPHGVPTTALSTERLLGAGVSGISFHPSSSGPSASEAQASSSSSSQQGGGGGGGRSSGVAGTNTSSEGEPRSSSFSHSQGSTLKYGELIVLGYNGCLPEGDKGRRRSRFVLRQRLTPNGVKPTVRHNVQCAQESKIYRDKSQHSVSYTLSRNSAVVVQYDHDEEKDMFQVGRSSDHPIDFVVVDTVPGAKRAEDCVVAQSTISRFSCRILISRKPPYKAWIFAAGFDSSKNIFLGEKATKWENESREQGGEIDGLTTNGILIMHPEGAGFSEASSPGCWREVSVGGGIYALRESRSAPQKSGLITKETNELRDGSLIDLCGATLLWRSASSLLLSPTRRHLERQVEAMNQGRPQCPVGLTTLVIPLKTHNNEANGRRGTIFDSLSARQPYAYLNCGHVHGHHDWGKGESSIDERQCPMCRKVGPYVRLTMGSETGFYVDPDCPSFCFNPCGHMASEKTVKYWSNVPIPHGCHGFRAICPFCATPLAGDAGFVKLIFQTDLD